MSDLRHRLRRPPPGWAAALACCAVALVAGVSAPRASAQNAQVQNPLVQSAPAPHALPLKNLRIELRQTQSGSRSAQDLSAGGSVVLSPGQSTAQVQIQGRAQDQQSQRGLAQQITVLNGRSAQALLGQTTPLRLWQTVPAPGGFRRVPSTVLLDQRSGLWVQARWEGGEDVELDARTALSGLGNPFRPDSPSAATETTLRLKLGEWVVLAESEATEAQQNQGLAVQGLGQGQQQTQSSFRVEVRVTVP